MSTAPHARLPALPPLCADAAGVARGLEMHLSLQASRLRGLRAGLTAIADGHAGYQQVQDLAPQQRRRVDVRL